MDLSPVRGSFENKSIISFVDHQYSVLAFSKPVFEVQVVVPTRTFIEKVLLLHTELFINIVNYRKLVTPLRDIDYKSHVKGKLSILPLLVV